MKTSVPVHPGKINTDVLAVSRVVCQSGAFYKSRLEKLLIVLSWAKQFLFPSRITSFNKRLLSINFDPLTRSKVSSGEQQFIRAEKQFSFLMSSKIIPKILRPPAPEPLLSPGCAQLPMLASHWSVATILDSNWSIAEAGPGRGGERQQQRPGRYQVEDGGGQNRVQCLRRPQYTISDDHDDGQTPGAVTG